MLWKQKKKKEMKSVAKKLVNQYRDMRSRDLVFFLKKINDDAFTGQIMEQVLSEDKKVDATLVNLMLNDTYFLENEKLSELIDKINLTRSSNASHLIEALGNNKLVKPKKIMGLIKKGIDSGPYFQKMLMRNLFENLSHGECLIFS